MLRLSLVLMMLLGSPARAGFYSGNELLVFCTDAEVPVCLGYIAGVADLLNDGLILPTWKQCIPENANLGQIKDVVVRYLTDHPQDRHYSAWSLVVMGIFEAFPCP